MKTNEVNKEIIGKHCKCIFMGLIITGIIEEIRDTKYTIDVKVHFDKPHRWSDNLYNEEWTWGRKNDDFGPLKYLKLLPDPVIPTYETLFVTFGESICVINGIFDDTVTWGVATLKEWIDSYESSRFTQIGDREAVITSEYNMNHVKEWLEKHTPIITLNTIENV